MTDALIVGAGHNGLAAAIALAKRGKKVTVLEARSTAGGLCAAREFHAGFTAPGIFHDTSEVRVHAPSASGKGLVLWNDAEKCADELGEDAAGYRELVRIVERARGPVYEALNTAPPALVPDALSEYFDLAKVGLSLRRMGAKDLYSLLRLLPMCLGDLMRDHFKSEAVMAAIAGQSLLSEYAGPWSAGTSARWFLSRIAAGKEVLGGPAALVRALEKSLAAAGGTIRTNARVEKLLV